MSDDDDIIDFKGGNLEPKQFDLFSDFLGLVKNKNEYSNLLGDYSLLPICILSHRDQNKVRLSGETNSILTSFVNKHGDRYSCSITPALLPIPPALKSRYKSSFKNEDDLNSAVFSKVLYPFYPGDFEFYLDRVLHKMLIDVNLRKYKSTKKETWVKFNYVILRENLSLIKKSLSVPQIKHALDVMLGSRVVIRKNGSVIHDGGMLVDRIGDDELSSKNTSMGAVLLPPIVTSIILNCDFSHYNFLLNNVFGNRLSTWIADRMTSQFRNVDFGSYNVFSITLKEILNESYLITDKHLKYQRRTIKRAVDELIKQNYIFNPLDKKGVAFFDEDIQYVMKQGKRYIDDVIYKLHPSPHFVKMILRSNKIGSEIKNLKPKK